MSAPIPLVDQLELALGTMPRLTRNIFLAHRLDLLDYNQIAARTGLSLGQVETHIASGIAHVDRVLSAIERPSRL